MQDGSGFVAHDSTLLVVLAPLAPVRGRRIEPGPLSEAIRFRCRLASLRRYFGCGWRCCDRRRCGSGLSPGVLRHLGRSRLDVGPRDLRRCLIVGGIEQRLITSHIGFVGWCLRLAGDTRARRAAAETVASPRDAPTLRSQRLAQADPQAQPKLGAREGQSTRSSQAAGSRPADHQKPLDRSDPHQGALADARCSRTSTSHTCSVTPRGVLAPWRPTPDQCLRRTWRSRRRALVRSWRFWSAEISFSFSSVSRSWRALRRRLRTATRPSSAICFTTRTRSLRRSSVSGGKLRRRDMAITRWVDAQVRLHDRFGDGVERNAVKGLDDQHAGLGY